MVDLKKSRFRIILDKINNNWNRFTESKTGKILLSNSLNYAISLTGAAIAVSGLFTPVYRL